MSERERYRIKAADATAIQDWLICNNSISDAAYRMACHIMRRQKNGEPAPTREDLAIDMGVVPRSVDRWLKELRDIEILDSKHDGRNNIYRFLKPKKRKIPDKKISDQKISDQKISDQKISDQKISDQKISDHSVRYSRSKASESRPRKPAAQNDHDSPVGVGVGSNSSKEEDPPTTNKRVPLKTELGRYMARRRFMAAPQFDDETLDAAAHIKAIEHMEREGYTKSQIVYFLQLDPPTSVAYPEQAHTPYIQESSEDETVSDTPKYTPEDAEEFNVNDDPYAGLPRLWAAVLGRLQMQTTRNEFRTWLKNSELLAIENGTATIRAPSALFKEGIENRYIGVIRDLIGQLYTPIEHIRIVIGGAPP